MRRKSIRKPNKIINNHELNEFIKLKFDQLYKYKIEWYKI